MMIFISSVTQTSVLRPVPKMDASHQPRRLSVESIASFSSTPHSGQCSDVQPRRL